MEILKMYIKKNKTDGSLKNRESMKIILFIPRKMLRLRNSELQPLQIFYC